MRGGKSRKVHGGADFPGGPAVKTLDPMQGLQAQFLVQNATMCGQKLKKKSTEGSGCK